jgi:Ras-related protein Rab-28
MVDKKGSITRGNEADSDDEGGDNEREPENLQYKVVVLGNGTVGKSSLIMRFAEDEFGRQYKQTIGVDFFVKRIQLPKNVNVAL